MTLQLPIQFGVAYKTRGGRKVRAYPIPGTDLAYIGEDPSIAEYKMADQQIVFRKDGAVNPNRTPHLNDLVAEWDEAAPAPASPCEHYDLMQQYMVDAAVMAQPWTLWQSRRPEHRQWTNLTSHPMWVATLEYRRKPRTLTVEGIEFPMPLTALPKIGETYWLASVANKLTGSYINRGEKYNHDHIRSRFAFATEADAHALIDAWRQLMAKVLP